MEERQEEIRNIIESGAENEIKEPHVRQIISTLGGKKISNEDMIKFKRLENVFRDISKLENGDSILNKLTGQIREMIINGANQQTNEGIVSIGQITNMAIGMSEKVFEESRSNEEAAKQQPRQTVGEYVEEARNRRNASEKNNYSNSIMSQEEHNNFKNDFISFVKGLGIDLNKEEEKGLANSVDDVRELASERNEDGSHKNEDAANLYAHISKAKDSKDTNEWISVYKEWINFFENRCRQVNQQIKDLEEKIKVATEENKDISNLLSAKELLENKLRDSEKSVEFGRACLEKLSLNKDCNPAQLFGIDAESIREFVEINSQLKTKEESSGKDSEYNELVARREEILKVQKVKELDEKCLDLADKIFDIGIEISSTSDPIKKARLIEEKDNLLKEYYVSASRLEKLKGLQKKHWHSESKKSSTKPVEKTSPENKSEGENIIEVTRRINNEYIQSGGKISYFDSALSDMRSSLGFLNASRETKYAVNITMAKYKDQLKSLREEILNQRGSNGMNPQKVRDVYVETFENIRNKLGEELKGLNISEEQRTTIKELFVGQAYASGYVGYRKYILNKTAERLRSEGKDTSRIDSMINRLERSGRAFGLIKGFNQRGELDDNQMANFVEAFKKVITGTISGKMKSISSKEEMNQLLNEVMNEKLSDDLEDKETIKETLLELMGKIYDSTGKDGVISLTENATISQGYLRMAELRTKNMLEKREILGDTPEPVEISLMESNPDSANKNSNRLASICVLKTRIVTFATLPKKTGNSRRPNCKQIKRVGEKSSKRCICFI